MNADTIINVLKKFDLSPIKNDKIIKKSATKKPIDIFLKFK